LAPDIDALPMTEHNTFAHGASADTPGKMHACGHDGTPTMLLGRARHFSKHRNLRRHTVYLIFQPAKKGGGGAARDIKTASLATSFRWKPCSGRTLAGMKVGSFASLPAR
jgi:hippurate hydrolase